MGRQLRGGSKLPFLFSVREHDDPADHVHVGGFSVEGGAQGCRGGRRNGSQSLRDRGIR